MLEATALLTEPQPLPYKLNFVILNYRCTAGHQFAWNGFTKQENMLFFVCCKADKLGTILPPMVSVLWAKRHETRSQERYWRYWLVSALKLTVFFKKNGPFPASFFFIFVFSIQLTVNKCSINFADDWIRTADLWYQKRPLYQLSHNHCPVNRLFLVIISTKIRFHRSIFITANSYLMASIHPS